MLGELGRFLGGEKATVLWDGLPAHRSRAMPAWLHTQRRWLVVERLPAYAPELNPVQGRWSWLKGSQLANLVCPTLREVVEQAELASKAPGGRHILPTRFFAALDSRSQTRQTNTQNPLVVQP